MISFGDVIPGAAGNPAKRGVLPPFVIVIFHPHRSSRPLGFRCTVCGQGLDDCWPPPSSPQDTDLLPLPWLGPGPAPPPAAWTLAEGVSGTRGEATFLSGPLPADEGSTWGLGSLAVLGGGVGKRRASLLTLLVEGQVGILDSY